MKQTSIAIICAALLAGCNSTPDTSSSQSTATNTATASAVTTMAKGDNLIQDPQFSQFRSNKGKSEFWKKHANKSAGLGDVGSSSVTAFGSEGSARLRFVSSSDDFSAEPALSQTIQGLKANTQYQLSFYYNDKKGINSPSQTTFGVKSLNGSVIKNQTITPAIVASLPQDNAKKGFKKVALTFNSGSNTSVTVYVSMAITDKSAIDLSGDIGKQTEVRVDEFSLKEL